MVPKEAKQEQQKNANETTHNHGRPPPSAGGGGSTSARDHQQQPQQQSSPKMKLERTKSILKQGSRERTENNSGEPSSPKREAISFAPEYELEKRKQEKRVSIENESVNRSKSPEVKLEEREVGECLKIRFLRLYCCDIELEWLYSTRRNFNC